MTPQDPRHGTTRGYHAGCHNACCRAAMARYEKAGRLARLNGGRAIPAHRAQRRLQALMALGWSSEAIAQAAGLAHRNHVWRVLNGQRGRPTRWVEQSTLEWVTRVYERLSMRVPDTPYAARTRRYAETRGWPPPLAWDDIDTDPEPARTDNTGGYDEAVVLRALAGEWRLATSPADRAEVAARWDHAGRSVRQLRQITGWKVERYYRAKDTA